MKLTDIATKDARLPDFMREGWLEETLKELDNANLTPEQRADWEIAIARNMTAKYAMEDQIKDEVDKRVRKAEYNVQKAKSDAQKAEYDTKRKAIINLLNLGVLSVDQIAKVQEVSEQFVLSIQAEISGRQP